MGFLDKFRSMNSESDVAPTLEQFHIPDDASLTVYNKPPPIPAVNRTTGGGLIVSMGVTSDQPEADLEILSLALENALSEGQPGVVLFEASRLSEAFLNTVPTKPARTIAWVLNPEVFTMWTVGAGLLQYLLYRWVNDSEAGLTAVLYVQGPETLAGSLLISILGNLGWPVRSPESDDGATVVEITRSDDVTLTCFTGKLYPPVGKMAGWLSDLWNRRKQAEMENRKRVTQQIDMELLRYLETSLNASRIGNDRTPVFARHLRRLIREVATGVKDADGALLKCLVEREAALAFPVDSSKGTASFAEWQNQGVGLEVFPDLSIAREIIATSDSDRSVLLGHLPSVDVLRWVAGKNAGLAIRLGDPDDMSRVLFVNPDSIATELNRFDTSHER